MNREEAIRTIRDLYPADSEYPDNAAIGRMLLEEAKSESWENESDAVLIRYAQLCIREEHIRANIKVKR